MAEKSGHPTNLLAATEPGARLSVKPTESTSGYVDGAWWPDSSDLVAQIPALVAQLADRWGPVDRVSYDIAAWAPAARRITAGGRRIRLDGFRGRRPADAVHVMGAGRRVRTLLVIPPTAEPDGAAETLRRAGATGNQENIDDLLHREPRSERSEPGRPTGGTSAKAGAHARIDDGDAAGLGRWDTEGGHDRRDAG
ncbi:MAG TPA: DUF5994 family protein [Nakamurella sp.]